MKQRRKKHRGKDVHGSIRPVNETPYASPLYGGAARGLRVAARGRGAGRAASARGEAAPLQARRRRSPRTPPSARAPPAR